MPVWETAIAVALSFWLALVACRVTGETDTTPVGAMGKVTQLIFGGLSPGNVNVNLMSANITAYSTAVGPSSETKKLLMLVAKFFISCPLISKAAPKGNLSQRFTPKFGRSTAHAGDTLVTGSKRSPAIRSGPGSALDSRRL